MTTSTMKVSVNESAPIQVVSNGKALAKEISSHIVKNLPGYRLDRGITQPIRQAKKS